MELRLLLPTNATLISFCWVIDELTPPDLSVEMAGLLPNWDLKLLEATGHLSTMEAPEACLAAMQNLIERAEQGR